jgi:hypothetical protein
MTDNTPVNDELELNLHEVQEIHYEIEHQPLWRSTADKEMDYADGNQLESDLLKRMQEIGIPPAVENSLVQRYGLLRVLKPVHVQIGV